MSETPQGNNRPVPLGESTLIEHVRLIGQAQSPQERRARLQRLADLVHHHEGTRVVLLRLLGADAPAQQLALELLLRLPLPLPAAVVPNLLPHLKNNQWPIALRLALATQLLRSVPSHSDQARLILRELTEDLNRVRALHRLAQLKPRLNNYAALDELIYQLESRVPIQCPRCPARLARPNMVKHLWHEHRLMLDGQRVREPWSVVRSWVKEYRRTGDYELLERAEELSEQLDPVNGLVWVQRVLCADGKQDPAALEDLRAEARARDALICPHCYALVPGPPEVVLAPLTVSHGRIAGRGFAIEVCAHGLLSKLQVERPDGGVRRMLEPGHTLTVHGWTFLLVAPIVALAMIAAQELPSRPGIALVSITSGILMIALLMYFWVRMRDLSQPPLYHRSLTHAWEQLVPSFHAQGYDYTEGDFVARLADWSLGIGNPRRRERSLTTIAEQTQAAVIAAKAPKEHLIALRRLEIADAAVAGRDPILLLAQQLGACFRGELPLEYAERLLADWGEMDWWTPGNRARLRILTLARAFESGCEVWDLHELIDLSPRLGASYQGEDLDSLTLLRQLWGIRTSRPWQRNGYATPVFDLARFPVLGGQYLQTDPDLLLFQPTEEEIADALGASFPILIRATGIVYRDVLLDQVSIPIEVKARGRRGGYELTLGSHRFEYRSDPARLASRLRGWLRFLYQEFLPGIDRALQHVPSRAFEQLLRQKRVDCPECHRPFVARKANLGRSLDLLTSPADPSPPNS